MSHHTITALTEVQYNPVLFQTSYKDYNAPLGT